ncbi:MAG: four helix bundle protein [Bacteroidales bacterium]|jgi:four helix bundle protein|nr:four helix bundle protein [Bacteroidales bacterium]MDD3131434.1 four helix bundle protein [Bacteroidales bacterium]MDD3527774.1 four helix bundle protein [Bacteroidales bacterium]MDD4178322.1 four helix bundle protein [Bacteroidales bacterium]MDD4742094.1 four helix bundle protein [Bacteroidales bacterium]
MTRFRFEQMEIWKFASEISNHLFDIADLLTEKKKYRFAEQLNAAAMSITNNIAEGSGSYSDKDFANFLNIARRSTFECANIIAITFMRGYIPEEVKEKHFEKLHHLSSMISNFRKTLLKTTDK